MPAGNLSRDQRRAEYKAYLASATWQEKRKAALERAEHRCQLCNRTKQLDVHHRTYERFGGDELPGDLTVLCRGCHEHFHDGRTPKGTKPRKPSQPTAVAGRIARAREHLLATAHLLTPGVAYTARDVKLICGGKATMSATAQALQLLSREKHMERVGKKRYRLPGVGPAITAKQSKPKLERLGEENDLLHQRQVEAKARRAVRVGPEIRFVTKDRSSERRTPTL